MNNPNDITLESITSQIKGPAKFLPESSKHYLPEWGGWQYFIVMEMPDKCRLRSVFLLCDSLTEEYKAVMLPDYIGKIHAQLARHDTDLRLAIEKRQQQSS